ncbi:hypothetical protein Daus18300_014449 [Diaporthe australafricana]|uniref:Serine hydrolase domain-containing protein n=1 Tax=Diaporthe australafricana TaxID=127596 RepID=A0ABR3VV50_9PEZI
MRILCLHGHGTSSAIFETQLTKVREELGASFEYIYLDGPVESERVRGMSQMVPGPFFGWFPGYTTAHIGETHALISETIEEDGPFDGIFGFSQGATLALSFLLQHEISHPGVPPPVRFAALFSCAGPAFSCDATLSRDLIRSLTGEDLRGLQARLHAGDVPRSFGSSLPPSARQAYLDTTFSALLLGADNGFMHPSVVGEWIASSGDDREREMPRLFHPMLTAARVRIPTAHILGRNDSPDVHAQAELCRLLCDPSYAVLASHSGAHDLPHNAEEVSVICEMIRATVEDAKLMVI